MHEHKHCDCHEHECSCHKEHERSPAKRLIFSGAFLAAAILAQFLNFPTFIYIPLFAAGYLLAGYAVLKSAAGDIFSGELFSENFLMSVASLGAFAIGEFAEAVAVMLLFEIGEALQHKAAANSRRSIKNALLLVPERVICLEGGIETVKEPKDIHTGDEILVPAGEKIPCDGVIIKGSGDIDASSLTGESLPLFKKEGDEVLSGTISLSARLIIRVTKEYESSSVSKILEMLEHAKEKKSKTESFIHRFARIYTPLVCIFALLVAVLPPLCLQGDFSVWLYRALCCLAASCPCALVISVPLGFFAGLGRAAKEGVLIKGSEYLETLSKTEIAAFDKTGTLTKGVFSYVGHENSRDEKELFSAVALCEKHSTHPIAKGAMKSFAAFATLEADRLETVSGKGVIAYVGSDRYAVGSEALMEELSVEYKRATLFGSSVYAAKKKDFLGSVSFADEIKEDSAKAISHLKALGISDIVMLSGDKYEIVREVAERVGICHFCHSMLPYHKAEALEELIKKGKTLYVGDGINDAPVLALADVGLAMGGMGSGAALEAADGAIMGESLTKVGAAIEISRKTMKILKGNIAFSLLVKLVIVVLSALGMANLWLAVFGDVGVCLIAVANAMRIMKK